MVLLYVLLWPHNRRQPAAVEDLLRFEKPVNDDNAAYTEYDCELS